MSKIIFMKYLPSFRPKLAPKKMVRIYGNLAYLIFQICQFWFKCQKNFMKFSPPVRLKLVPKLKMLRIHWNLAYTLFYKHGVFIAQP